MTSEVKPIPDGYHSVTPYLCVRDAAGAIEFYKKAFGAVEIMRLKSPEGKVGHAEIRIGDSLIMLADEYPEIGFKSPQTVGGTPVMLHLYIENSDAVVEQAVAAGAKLVRPVQDKFYGDRAGAIEDPFGHSWYISTHKEDVPPEEIERRAAAPHASGS